MRDLAGRSSFVILRWAYLEEFWFQTAQCLAFTQYESNSDRIRDKFEEHGEIKTFFDLIKNRGMVFVTYVSRAVTVRLERP